MVATMIAPDAQRCPAEPDWQATSGAPSPQGPTKSRPTPTVDSSAPAVPSAPGHRSDDTRLLRAGGTISQGPTGPRSTPITDASDPAIFDELRLWAECYEDAQRSRIQMTNRIGSGTVQGDAVADALDALRFAETKLALTMKRAFRKATPDVYQWVKETPGLGEHSMARLLGMIGHPVHAYPYHWEGEGAERELVAEDPFDRSVSQLWSYCGHGDPLRRKRKGMSADEAAALGNPRAKMIVHLIAESAMKCKGGAATGTTTPNVDSPPALATLLDDAPTEQVPSPSRESSGRRRSPYRDTYDEARLRYAHRDGWTLGHQHNAALRLVGKTILRDLWVVAS